MKSLAGQIRINPCLEILQVTVEEPNSDKILKTRDRSHNPQKRAIGLKED